MSVFFVDEYRHFYFYKRFHFHIYWLEKARKLFALGQYPVEGIEYIAFKGGNVYVGKYFVVRKPKSTGYFWFFGIKVIIDVII